LYGPYVCSNSSTADFFKAVIFIGIFIGYPVVLWFADNYGRKLSVMISWGITVFGCAMLSFSQNIEMALVGLLFSGAGSEAAIRVSMVSFAEVVDFYKRQKYSVALEISCGIAGVLIGGLYYVIHNWRTINIFIIFLLSVIEYVFFIFYFQETPKYAIKKGIEYGIKSLNFVGEANKGKKNIIKE
jgi:MFS family permease